MPCLMIDPVDFSKPLYGSGGLAIAGSALRVLGNRLHLVGMTSENHRIGRWTRLTIQKQEFNFLPVARVQSDTRPRFLSANLDFALAVALHSSALRATGIASALTQTYTVLWYLAWGPWRWNICFYYPGLGNPMTIGRRSRLGRYLAPVYERIQALALCKTTVAFAAADGETVERYNTRLRRFGVGKKVEPLPTAVDLECFRPLSKSVCRQQLGLPQDALIMTFVGRLAQVKGIPLILEVLKHLQHRCPRALLLLVGDGEKQEELWDLTKQMALSSLVRFLGRCGPNTVATAVGAADVCVCGSHTEGFSVAMVEQLACGRPIVSTDVSGARDVILEGQNGFVVSERDSRLFARRVLDAAQLVNAEEISRRLAEQNYAEQSLWHKVQEAWPALRD